MLRNASVCGGEWAERKTEMFNHPSVLGCAVNIISS